MANPTTFPGDIIVSGNMRISGSVSPLLAKSSVLAQADLQEFNIPWTWWRTYNAMGSNLPSAAAEDDLGLVCGTHGTAHPTLQAGDVGGAMSARYARAVIPLPWEYVAGQTVTFRFYAGCLTSAPDTECTLSCQVYHTDGDTSLHADGNISPAATTNNMQSTVFDNIDFTLAPVTNLSPGSELDVLLFIGYEDSANAAVMIPTIGKCQLLCDVR